MGQGVGRILAAYLLLCSVAALASDTPPLPDPLTLNDALALARPDLPVIEMALAERDASAADLAEARSLSAVRLSAVGRLRVIEPSSVSDNSDNNDSSASLALSKRLYDFGYSEALEASARLAGDGSEWRQLDARQKAHLRIMQSFLDVILADLQYARDNEAMAGAYVEVDRARDRHELDRISDVALLELEAEYQDALQLRNESQALQRMARSQLAIAMGRPGDLAANLVRPPAPDTALDLPEYEDLLAEVMQGNPSLKAWQAEVKSAQAGVKAARAGHGPVISGELDASYYNRETNSTNPLGAGLVLEVPLLTGGARDAAVAEAWAGLRSSQAQLAATGHQLRQQVLELWLRLGNLGKKLAALKVRGDYRELYLDRSRALYELEVKTDLGDAMTEMSAVRLDVAHTEFAWMMAQAELAALAGRLLPGETVQ
jgi:outer membrane protein TolC